MGRLRRLLEGKPEETLAEQEKEFYDRPSRSGTYYWVFIPRTRTLVGYKNSEDEAYQFGYSLHNEENFEVIALHTRDRHEASSMIKGRMLDTTGNLEESIKRMKHKRKED